MIDFELDFTKITKKGAWSISHIIGNKYIDYVQMALFNVMEQAFNNVFNNGLDFENTAKDLQKVVLKGGIFKND